MPAWASGKACRVVLAVLVATSLVLADEESNAWTEKASADTGQPIMFQRGRLIWGLSTRPVTVGETLFVLLWIYNPSDEPQSVMSCMDIDWFWARDIEILDSAGKHVASRAEERRAEEARKSNGPVPRLMEVCTRNFPITIPPKTCLHGSFARPEYDFARDLNYFYALPAGRYSLVPIVQKRTGQISRAANGQMPRLEIIIREP